MKQLHVYATSEKDRALYEPHKKPINVNLLFPSTINFFEIIA